MKFKTNKIIGEITRLAIFDLDGTLISTATPEEGKELWESKTGKTWPHVGWWSKPESLDNVIFPNDIIEETKKGYDEFKDDPNTLMVVMTGRLEKKLSNEVDTLLKIKGLEFDVHALNWGGETSSVKTNQMTQLLEKFPNTKEIIMWEDRQSHFDTFTEFGETLQNIKFSLVKIETPEIRFK